MRLIDSDALTKEIEGWFVFTDDLFGMGKLHERELIRQLIDEAPTIDAVPVVRGEWIEHEDEMECPQCGYFWNYCDNDTERFNYCPNCGAKMEGKPWN